MLHQSQICLMERRATRHTQNRRITDFGHQNKAARIAFFLPQKFCTFLMLHLPFQQKTLMRCAQIVMLILQLELKCFQTLLGLRQVFWSGPIRRRLLTLSQRAIITSSVMQLPKPYSPLNLPSHPCQVPSEQLPISSYQTVLNTTSDDTGSVISLGVVKGVLCIRYSTSLKTEKKTKHT